MPIMKKLILLLGLSSLLLGADAHPTLNTTRGREYKDVTVVKVEPDGLRIRHESGTAKIPFSELPVSIQKKYGYDQAAAESYRKEYERNAAAVEADLDEAIRASNFRRSAKTAPPTPSDEASTRPSAAPQGANPSSGPTDVKLQAATSSMGRGSDTSWQTSWGSYDTSVFRARAVSVTVRAATGGDAVIELHWIGSEAGRRSNQGVVKVDRKPVTLIANQPITHEFGGLFVENDTKYAALGERYHDGLKYAGWVARVVGKDGAVLAIQAARPPMIRFVK
jgi:hypothetical protein